MRIWTLVALLFTVTAVRGDRGMEASSRFFDRVIATSARSNPFNEFQQGESAAAEKQCCKACKNSKPCGDTCIEKDDVCHLPAGVLARAAHDPLRPNLPEAGEPRC
jgi:hypothetical protein